ncbi:MAG: FecR domain-containing protein [Dysgonamonadaceae bacterium]|jgi:ferric-dicitrate binding protein FerR (iron transport regulator)|nr:FecR domain-containing protein [Dysgonamonadaceae bacterium]
MEKKNYSVLFEKYLADKTTMHEKRTLIRFLSTNPEIDDWFREQIQASSPEISGDLKQKMYLEIMKMIQETNAPGNKTRKPLRLLMRVAAAVFLPIALAFGIYHFYFSGRNSDIAPIRIEAERGEKANVTLPDGSRVWLNSNSHIVCYNAYNHRDRQLVLDGEAYFEVAHNPSKPFVVQCGDFQVEALGTAFDIKAYHEDSIVYAVLAEGKVKLSFADKNFFLTPNERIVLNKTTKTATIERIDATDFTDWRRNRLRFENEYFADIAKTISRIYNVEYLIADESIKTLRFTGAVDNTNIESVLNVITLTSPVFYTIENSLIVFHEDKRKKDYFKSAR